MGHIYQESSQTIVLLWGIAHSQLEIKFDILGLLFIVLAHVPVVVVRTVAGMVGGSYSTSTVQEHYLYSADIESTSLSEIWSEYKAY